MEKLKHFIRVAKGEEKAALVLKNAMVFHAFTGEFLPADVAIADSRIAGIGAYSGEQEIDLAGKYLTPGFVDSHIHIESSMLSPLEFARAIVPLGTTTIVADPHEIANVTGLDGIRYLLAATEDLPLNAYFMLPSCVPATNLENAGARLEASDLAELMADPRVLGLGEMMNYPGVLTGDDAVLAKLLLASGKRIDGHAPDLTGQALMAYAAAGVESDHECVTPEQARLKLRAGMHILIREGSAAKNLHQLLPIINEATAQFCCFAADDRHPADLLQEGHINHMVRLAIAAGVPLALALQMATINAARYFRLPDVGAIAPRYKADLLVFDDLETWQPVMVFKDGKLVAKQKKSLFASRAAVPENIRQTVRVRDFSPADLKIRIEGTKAHVIGLVPQQIVTQHLEREVPVRNGEVLAAPEQDLLKLVVFERHRASGNIGLGLVSGFGLRQGAIASTIAHDSHNLIAIGSNDADIAAAVEELRRIQGGIALAAGGEIKGSLALPIGGLMSEESLDKVEETLAAMKAMAYDMGVAKEYDPFLTLAFLSLPVIPALKLTDLGLVDVEKFALIPLAAEKRP